MDIDLYCREAVLLASYFLPATKTVIGRASKRRSHWLYTSDLAQKQTKSTLQFTLPSAVGPAAVLLEARLGL